MLSQFLREEEGQSTVEYMLIIAVVVVTIHLLGRGMKENITKTVDQVFQNVNLTITNFFAQLDA